MTAASDNDEEGGKGERECAHSETGQIGGCLFPLPWLISLTAGNRTILSNGSNGDNRSCKNAGNTIRCQSCYDNVKEGARKKEMGEGMGV